MGDSDLEYALKQVEDLQKKGLSPEVKIKVDTAMAERATSSKDDIIAEIKELVQRAINTDKTFENIRVQLGVVDQNDYKDKYGAAIPKLQPTWVKYQKRWTALLWRSRNAATRAEAYLRDFVDVVLDTILEEDSTYEDNLKDLNAFIKRPNPDNPLLQSDDFAKLQADVEAFTATFATYADDLGAQISTKITTLQTDIATLKKELVECNKLVVQMGIALGVTVGAVAIGIGIVALFALGPAAPAAIVSILVAGIGAAITELSQLIAALTRKNTIESDIAEKQKEIDDLNVQLEVLGKVKSQLQRCAEEASEMFGRLESFSNIWDLAAQDADLISKSDLDKVHTDKLVQARIELIQSSYAVLADALAEYATTIDTSDVTPPPAYTAT